MPQRQAQSSSPRATPEGGGPALILSVSGGPLRGRKAALWPGETLVVGRSEKAGFSMPSAPRLSARHFEISWDGAASHLRDLESLEGTRLDGQPVTEAEAHHAAWIRAGDTDFTVHVEAHTPANDDEEDDAVDAAGDEADEADEAPFPTEEMETEADEEGLYADDPEVRWNARQARRRLRKERTERQAATLRAAPLLREIALREPLHAVLDAARTPRILQVLREAVEEHRSLYEGTAGEALDEVAPYLVRLEGGSRLLSQLVAEGWTRRWGIYLEGDVRRRDMRRHLRRFLIVEEDDTRERLYFRYYDPGALRDVWPTCSRRQKDELLGPLRAFLLEGPRGEVLRLSADRDIESLTHVPRATGSPST